MIHPLKKIKKNINFNYLFKIYQFKNECSQKN